MVWIRVYLMALLCSGVAEAAPQPPPQPSSGPGGADYRHAKVVKKVYGTGDEQYWIFTPASPTPKSAPLIVFNHGWSATNPKFYGAWIDHIVRRGNIVIFPRYQADLRTPTKEFTPNAMKAVKEAIRRLRSTRTVQPELDKFAIVGHSVGGILTANMAALAHSWGFPEPKAILSVQPGNSWKKSQRIAIPIEDLSQIPSTALLICVVGDTDRIVRDIDAKRIFYETPQISLTHKDFVILMSDNHGDPPLRGSHYAPAAVDEDYDSGERQQRSNRKALFRLFLKRRIQSKIREQSRHSGFPPLFSSGLSKEEISAKSVNALDYYGTWKLSDALCDAAFYGKNREYALGNTPQQRFMGRWSDGIPVKELQVTDNP